MQYYRKHLNSSRTIPPILQEQSSTPDPKTTPESPMRRVLYTQLDNFSQPKSYCMSEQKSKKFRHRHRRISSGTLSSAPKYCSNRDRHYQSEPETQKVKLVSTETQTDAMEVSDIETSSVSLSTSQDTSIILYRDRGKRKQLQKEFIKPHTGVTKKDQNQSFLNMELTSPNGNLNNISFQNFCSSPEQLINDVMNSNQRKDIQECYSDNENLEKLGRKVNEFMQENHLSTKNCVDPNQEKTLENNLHSENGNSRKAIDKITCTSLRASKTLTMETKKNKTAEYITNANGEINQVMYDDSWSDEDGEDSPYNYSLRRRSIARLPIGRGVRPRRYYKNFTTNKVAVHKRNNVVMSDEEFTSEYSISPNSLHSTVENNIKILNAIQKMNSTSFNTTLSNTHSDVYCDEFESRKSVDISKTSCKTNRAKEIKMKYEYCNSTEYLNKTNTIAVCSTILNTPTPTKQTNITIITNEPEGVINMI